MAPARCPICGHGVPFGGRTTVRNAFKMMDISRALLSTLWEADATFAREGRRLAESLHDYGHRRPVPNPDWRTAGLWMKEAKRRLAAPERTASELASEVLRMQREQPVAWDFGKAMAREALDTRSAWLVNFVHSEGEGGAHFYAEEIARNMPALLRERVAAGDLELLGPLTPGAEEACRISAYVAIREWLSAEPR